MIFQKLMKVFSLNNRARKGPDEKSLPTEPFHPKGGYASSCLRAGAAQTIGKRPNQEDAFYVSDPGNSEQIDRSGLLALMSDGIGGLNGGERASGEVVRTARETLARLPRNESLSDGLLRIFGRCQENVLAINRSGGGCGATLVSVLIRGREMALLSVGDSRIALVRSGMLLTLNREHTFARETDDRMILAGDMPVTDEHRRKALTAYVGQEGLRLVDRTLNPIRLQKGDRIILMSDGVFGTVSDDEILSAQGQPPQQAAEMIVRMVERHDRPAQDNATIVIIEIG